MVKKRKTMDSWKKKEWYTIVAPEIFEGKQVGNTLAEEPEKLVNRIMEVPLSELTGNPTHQFVKLWFRVNDVKGKTANTVFDGYELTKEYIRRNVRRRKSMIKSITDITTKDNRKLQVTAIIFTLRKADTAKKDVVRKLMDGYLKSSGSADVFGSYVQKLIFGNVAGEIFKQSKQVLPLRRVEITKAEVHG